LLAFLKLASAIIERREAPRDGSFPALSAFPALSLVAALPKKPISKLDKILRDRYRNRRRPSRERRREAQDDLGRFS